MNRSLRHFLTKVIHAHAAAHSNMTENMDVPATVGTRRVQSVWTLRWNVTSVGLIRMRIIGHHRLLNLNGTAS